MKTPTRAELDKLSIDELSDLPASSPKRMRRSRKYGTILSTNFASACRTKRLRPAILPRVS
jgi:hypothetical protein